MPALSLLLGACAVLAGARSFAAVAEYAHDASHAVLQVLGAGTVVPHESTIRRVLQQLDAQALEAALRTWALAQLAARAPAPGTPVREQRRVFALNGRRCAAPEPAPPAAAATATSRSRRRIWCR